MLCNKCNVDFEDGEEIKIVFNEADDNKLFVCEKCFSKIQESKGFKNSYKKIKEKHESIEEENNELTEEDLDNQIERELSSKKIEEKRDPDLKWNGYKGNGKPIKARKGWL